MTGDLMDAIVKRMKINTVIRLRQDTAVEFDTQGGSTVIVVLPKGTMIEIPSIWICDGVPRESIYASNPRYHRP